MLCIFRLGCVQEGRKCNGVWVGGVSGCAVSFFLGGRVSFLQADLPLYGFFI